LPARPPRGKARLNIYLDEYAHVMYDRDIYTAALPIISKGGRLRMGSSPLGASGVFWEVYTEKLRPYPGYVRRATPWWGVYAFCNDIRQARDAAPQLSPVDRVARFGNARIQTIFANMPTEDFRQEYETDFVDESVAWITWEEIQAVQDAALFTVQAISQGKAIDGALAAIERLIEAVRLGKVERVLVGGVDIGRTHDTTELYLVGQTTTGTYPLRLMLSLAGVEYDDQFAVIAYALRSLPIVKLLIDQTGLGNNLAENLAKTFPTKAEGVTFTNPSKALWATDAKMLIQQRKTPLPVDRDLAYQIHSIKRLRTGGAQMSFDTEGNEKHHADRFWAWALALASCLSRAPVAGTWGQRK
jgi:phage FluMu gp28-like protein